LRAEESLQDTKLLHLFNKGDETAFDLIVNRYENAVRSVLYRVVGNRDDAEDLSQETFLRVYKFASRFRGKSSLKTWILRIAINLAIDLMKLNKRIPSTVSYDEVLIKSESKDSNPQERLDLSEKKMALTVGLNKLPPKQRAAIVLKIIEGMTNSEIAETMEISKDAVKANIYYARKQLLLQMEIFEKSLSNRK